jgi:hypothetical protein
MELIYKSIAALMDDEFLGWYEEEDCKSLCHNFICSELDFYNLTDKQWLELESRLIEYAIKQGVK